MNTFDTLPDSARLWLFHAEGPVPAQTLAQVRAFLPTWASHGRPVTAAADRVADSVLAVAAVISPEEFNAGVSGCGIDSMTHAVDTAFEATGLTLASPLTVTFGTASGEWKTVPRGAFRKLVKSGEADSETPVLDLTAATLGELRARGLVRPAAEAWHGRAFGLRVAA